MRPAVLLVLALGLPWPLRAAPIPNLGPSWAARTGADGSLRSLTGGAIPLLREEDAADAAPRRVLDWLGEHEGLGISPGSLRTAAVTRSASGRLISVRFDVTASGVPILGASVTAVLSSGRLIGLHAVGTASRRGDAIDDVGSAAAVAVALDAAGLARPGILSERLAFLPLPDGALRLVHEIVVRDLDPSRPSRMRALVDARSGELVSLTDETISACAPLPPAGTLRRVLGGVKPQTTSDAERPELLPQASVGSSVAGADGFFAPPGTPAPGRLEGPAVTIECVDCSTPVAPEAAVNADGDADFGSGGADAAGNGAATPSDRAAFFHASAARALASRWLAVPFVSAPLPIRTNIPSACNASWDGAALNFFRASARCSNTGESRDVVQHEWGHGLDQNDGTPSPPLAVDGATGEAIADAVAMLRSRDACIGEGFFVDPADGPSAACSGVRDLDELSPGHRFGAPATLSAGNAAALCPPSGFYRGPLGREGHCEGEILGQALWHLLQNLRTGRSYGDASPLPDGALADDDAWEHLERLVFEALPMLASYAPSTLQSIGMSAHEALLLADDEGDGLANGTPHAAAITEAFGHHGILESALAVPDTAACAAPSSPPVTVTGTTDADAGTPALEISWTDTGADGYWLLRADDAGDAYLPLTARRGPGAGTFVDRAVLPGRSYLYRVAAETGDCLSPAVAAVAGSPGAVLRVAAMRVDDAGAAIPDGLLEPGETVDLEIDLENAGLLAATSVRATIDSGDPRLTVLAGGPIDYGTLLPGAIVAAPSAFRVRAAADAPLHVLVTVSGDSAEGCLRATAVLDVAAPWLERSGESLDDSITGDGDGSWEPGESVDLAILLDNVGTRTADPVTGTLSFRGAPVPGVTIDASAASWPAMAPGAAAVPTAAPVFRLSADMTTGPRTRVPLRLDVAIGGIAHRSFDVDPQVGRLPAGNLKWTYQGVPGTYVQDITPVIVPLDDDDGDGLVTACDPAEIMVIEFRSTGSALLALDGATGVPKWELVDPCTTATSFNGMAAGDMDGDGENEIVVADMDAFICCISAGGSVEWRSAAPASVGSSFQRHAAPQVHDLDADTIPEVIAGHTVLRGDDGSVKWEFPRNNSGRVIVGDLDLDGGLEVLAGSGGAYRFDGSPYPFPLGNVDTFQAGMLGNLDADPEAEIVTTSGSAFLKAWNHDGTVLFQVPSPGARGAPGPAALGDFDGDGSPEIAVPNVDALHLFDADGSLRWSRPIDDRTGSSGIAGFDFDSDGTPELVYRDHELLQIFDGATGDSLWSTPVISGTAFEHPVIADVDADGHADIVVNDGYVPSRVSVRCFSSPEWPPARATWSQEDYSVANVGDTGAIPARPAPRWLAGNDWRVQASACACPGMSLGATWQPADCLSLRTCFAIAVTGAAEPHVTTWDFGDGSPMEDGDVPCHLFPAPGGYAVRARVTDAAGCTEEWTSFVEVAAPLQLAITAPAACPGVPACFAAAITGGRAPVDVEWDFGDGSPRAPGLAPCHAFTPGSWTVTAFARDAAGCLSEASARLDVGSAPPDVGGVLFVTDHGDPAAPLLDALLSWTGDLGAPRDPGDSYEVLRSLDPRRATFAPVPGTAGLLLPSWRDSTPRSPVVAPPVVHHYLVFARNACGTLSGN